MNSLSQEQKAFLLGELIGKKVVAVKASSKSMQGIEGIVLDDTKNAFLLETERGRKLVPKKACEFLFPESGARIKGVLLVCRPEERTKKLFQRTFLSKKASPKK